MLADVLRRRSGIPITLAIVVIEVAERLGVAATGVGMPGHFLVGDGPVPFALARRLRRRDVARRRHAAVARFDAIHGAAATFDRSSLPTPRPQVSARVLANLAGIYRSLGDPTSLLRTGPSSAATSRVWASRAALRWSWLRRT